MYFSGVRGFSFIFYFIKCNVGSFKFFNCFLSNVDVRLGSFKILLVFETLVAKMSKEPQPPLGGMFGNEYFGHIA